jgi:endonuclease YncB( thermonuclease family)
LARRFSRYPSRTRPLWRTAIDTAILITVVGLAVFSADRAGLIESSTGRYHVTDGDSITYRGQRIRLQGIDAPELQQTCDDVKGHRYACGKDARAALRTIIGADEIRCVVTGNDRYGRKLAYCKRGKTDINKEMVRQGWAIAYARHLSTYLLVEADARNAKRGLWAGTFENPQVYRDRNRYAEGSIIEDDE